MPGPGVRSQPDLYSLCPQQLMSVAKKYGDTDRPKGGTRPRSCLPSESVGTGILKQENSSLEQATANNTQQHKKAQPHCLLAQSAKCTEKLQRSTNTRRTRKSVPQGRWNCGALT
jgi:hypothetical protein